jgi:hypothetical protein
MYQLGKENKYPIYNTCAIPGNESNSPYGTAGSTEIYAGMHSYGTYETDTSITLICKLKHNYVTVVVYVPWANDFGTKIAKINTPSAATTIHSTDQD